MRVLQVCPEPEPATCESVLEDGCDQSHAEDFSSTKETLATAQSKNCTEVRDLGHTAFCIILYAAIRPGTSVSHPVTRTSR
jgi:hypothetical protein